MNFKLDPAYNFQAEPSQEYDPIRSQLDSLTVFMTGVVSGGPTGRYINRVLEDMRSVEIAALSLKELIDGYLLKGERIGNALEISEGAEKLFLKLVIQYDKK